MVNFAFERGQIMHPPLSLASAYKLFRPYTWPLGSAKGGLDSSMSNPLRRHTSRDWVRTETGRHLAKKDMGVVQTGHMV